MVPDRHELDALAEAMDGRQVAVAVQRAEKGDARLGRTSERQPLGTSRKIARRHRRGKGPRWACKQPGQGLFVQVDGRGGLLPRERLRVLPMFCMGQRAPAEPGGGQHQFRPFLHEGQQLGVDCGDPAGRVHWRQHWRAAALAADPRLPVLVFAMLWHPRPSTSTGD